MRHILVFRHGIGVNRWFLLPMERHFRRRGYEVRNRSYPSRRKTIEEHGDELAEELRAIDAECAARGEEREISCVTHSMGGLLLRRALAHSDLPRVKRAVMLVPPNQGSATARGLWKFFLTRWILGSRAGRQLAEAPPGIFAALGTPEGTEIGIIAGKVPWKIYPVRLARPHDGLVSVEETALPPFPQKVLPYGHSPILWVRSVWEETAHFLEHGRFLAPGEKPGPAPFAAGPPP